MVFPHLSLLVHFENSARENDLNSSLESIIYMFWSLKHELQAVPTKYDSSTDLGHCEVSSSAYLAKTAAEKSEIIWNNMNNMWTHSQLLQFTSTEQDDSSEQAMPRRKI